jgi:hypothetical protein
MIGGLTVRCLRRPVLYAATSSCGRTGCPGMCDLLRSAVRQPLPLLPPGRNHRDPSAAAPTVMSAGRCAGDRDRSAGRSADSRCPRPVPHRRSVSEPLAHNGHMQWLRCGVRRGVRPAGRVDRWADTPTVTVPAGRTCDAVGVRPPWPPRCWGRTAAEPATDTPDGSAAAVRGGCPGFRAPADTAYPAMACVRA